MKKLILTVATVFALCGSMFAQLSQDETHWPEFYFRDYDSNQGIYAYVRIDGQLLSPEGSWGNNLEFATFANEQVRSNGLYQVWDYDPEWDYAPWCNITSYYNNSNEEISFVMYDHNTGTEYTECFVSFWSAIDTPVTLLTGIDYNGLFNGEDDVTVVLNFTSPSTSTTKTLEIEPYTGEKDNYYLIAAPLGSVTANMVEGLRTPSFDFYSFNQEEDAEWINLRDEEEFELQPGVGFLYANNTGTDLVFSGTPLQGEAMEIALDYSENEVYWRGWNLVGNPFEVSVYPDRPFYTMNEDRSGYASHSANDELPAMCGAFVQADGEGENVTMHKTPSNKASRLDLNLSNNRCVVDRAIVSFGGGQQLSKFMFRENSTKVYIPMEGKDYAVVSAEGMGEMPVNFKAEKSGSYTISAKGEEVNFTYLHLIDNMTGADVDLLATPSYSFNASTTDYESRFRLLFATGSSEDGDNFGFVNSAGNFCVYGIEGEATLQVYDVLGHMLSSETFSGSIEKKVNAATGVYMMRLINGNDVKVQKVIIK